LTYLFREFIFGFQPLFMMHNNRAKFFVLAGIFFLFSTIANAQDSSRLVKSMKVFLCEMDRDTFRTAEEGCKHFAEKHLPGYKYQQLEIANNGAVKCVCTKAGEPDNDQQGKIYGVVICPPLATEVVDETPFLNKMCECPTPGYIAKDGKCIPLKPRYGKGNGGSKN
jgi:hypothetical protein